MHMVEAFFQEFLRERLILNRNVCTIKYLAHIIIFPLPLSITLTGFSQGYDLQKKVYAQLLDD